MGDVNYNLSAATKFAETIDSAVDEIKRTIETEWEALKSEFRIDWVGEDEDAFENELLKNVQTLFYNVNSVAGSSCSFIINAANALAEFTSNISQNFGGAVVSKLDDYIVKERTLDIVKDSQSFSETTQRGLVSDNSDQKLIEALTNFCDNVSKKIAEAYQQVDAGNSFVSNISPDNAIGMKNFIESIGESSTKLTNILNSFKNETIPQLVEAYKKQHETLVSDSKTAQSNVESEIARATSNE